MKKAFIILLLIAGLLSFAYFFYNNSLFEIFNKRRADMQKIIDLTHKFTKSMPVHSFDDPVSIEKIRNLIDDKYNDWRLSCAMHVGTHIDGPGHLTDSDVLISDFSADKFVGKGYLIDARNKPIDESLLKDLPLQEGLIVLILTGSDKKFGTKEYYDSYPIISVNFAKELVKHKIKMVGIDFFSPDKYPFDTHKVFFSNNILIIENLTNLESLVGIKDFTIVALPLKLETDSALARVIAIVN
jgi:kynurenine formamidase